MISEPISTFVFSSRNITDLEVGETLYEAVSFFPKHMYVSFACLVVETGHLLDNQQRIPLLWGGPWSRGLAACKQKLASGYLNKSVARMQMHARNNMHEPGAHVHKQDKKCRRVRTHTVVNAYQTVTFPDEKTCKWCTFMQKRASGQDLQHAF